MSLEYTTPVPNRIFDIDMSNLKEVELKVLLVVIRKTHGWVEQKNHRQRRQVQRINIKSFETLTGCSKRGISTAIQSLVQKQLVIVYDYNGKTLTISDDRKGKYHLYFKPNILPVENPIQPRKYLPMSCAKFAREQAQNLPYTIKESMRKKKLNQFNFYPNQSPSEPSSLHISRHIKNYSL